MKKMLFVAGIVVILMTLSAGIVLAGDRNSNGPHGSHGTGIENGKEGCRAGGGDYYVYVPTDLPPGWSNEWLGGPCCPSNISSGVGNDYPLPNQCCNPPDDVHPQPGNHCECFEMRGYPIPNAIP
jgi:hypothetical protein